MPATVITPGAPAGPGAKLPPALTMVEPTVPLPPNVAPLFTMVRPDRAIEPSTISAPAFTVVGPV